MPTSQEMQESVRDWLVACFGKAIADDKVERNHRFLEEALELVQSAGMTVSEAVQLVVYVYGRPMGAVDREVGGVMITLISLCLAHRIDCFAELGREMVSVWQRIDAIRAKQAAKPKHSPLPQATAQSAVLQSMEIMAEDLNDTMRRMAEKTLALKLAARRFRQYEDHHAAKGNLDGDVKARANAEMAALCEKAAGR